jgi:hypothetical protein
MASGSCTSGPANEPRRPRGQPRLLKNGAAAHKFTREDRAKGGRKRAKKIRRRKELREQFEAADFEDLAVVELDLFGRRSSG